MNTDSTIYLMGRIREVANNFILKELSLVGFIDLAPSHGDILAALFQHKELPMTEIANRIHRDRSTVTTLVQKLVKLEYVSIRKDPEDNRTTIVFLTEKGKALEPHFREISLKLYETEYKGISAQEIQIFQSVLEKIYNNF